MSRFCFSDDLEAAEARIVSTRYSTVVSSSCATHVLLLTVYVKWRG